VTLLSGSKRDHSPPSSAKVKNKWSYTTNPICLHGMHRDNFTFTLYKTYFSLMSKKAQGAQINVLGAGSDSVKHFTFLFLE